MDPRQEAELEARADHEMHRDDMLTAMHDQMAEESGWFELDRRAAAGWYDEDAER